MLKGQWAAWTALVVVAFASPAFAQSQVLSDACTFLSGFARWLIAVGYICGSLGLVMISIRASAQGRFSMGGFGGILLGMFTLAMIPSIIGYLISGQFGWNNC